MKRDFEFSLNSVDACGRVKHKYIAEIFQEMAELAAYEYGFAVSQTIKRGMTWVLRDYRIEFDKYPTQEDKVLKINTYAEIYRNLFSLRTFEVRNAKDELLGVSRSWWVYMDILKKRPVRLNKVEGIEVFLPQLSPVYPAEVKIPSLNKTDLEYEWRARWQDLDVNDHVNHTIYFGWVLETVPVDVPRYYAPVKTEATYLKPILREKVICRTEEIEETDTRNFVHSLVNGNGEECAKFSSSWLKDGREKVEAL